MTEEEVFEQLSQDPVFQRADQKTKVSIAMGALRSAGLARQDTPQEQPEVEAVGKQSVVPEMLGGDPYAAGATAVESVAQGAGAMAGRQVLGKTLSKGLQMIPHPLAKGAGLALEFAGGIAGAGAAGGAAGATRSKVSEAIGREDLPVGDAAIRGAEEGAIGEVGGRAIESVSRGLGRAITGKARTPEDLSALTAAEARGIQLRPSEVSGSNLAGGVEQAARQSLFGVKKFQDLDIKNAEALKDWAEGTARQYIGGVRDPRVAGQIVQDAIEGKAIPQVRALERQLYNEVDAKTSGVFVYAPPVRAQLQALRKTVDPRTQPKASALLDQAVDMMTNPQTNTAKPLTFTEAADLRSMMLEIGRDRTEVLSDRLGGIAKGVAGALDHAMENAANRAGGDAAKTWRRANTVARAKHELFDDAVIRSVMESRPEDVVKVAFKRNQITETEKVMSALRKSGDQSVVRSYQGAAMGHLIGDAMSDGYLDGRRLYNSVYGRNGIGREVMEKTFGKSYMAEFDKLLNVAKRLNQSSLPGSTGNVSGTARSLIRWGEQGAMLQLPAAITAGAMTGQLGLAIKDAAVTGTYFLGQHQLAKVLNSKKGVEMMRRGMLLGRTSTEALKLIPRIIAIAAGETMDEPLTGDILSPSRRTQQPTAQ